MKNVKIPLLSALINLPSHPTIWHNVAKFFRKSHLSIQKTTPDLRRSRKRLIKFDIQVQKLFGSIADQLTRENYGDEF